MKRRIVALALVALASSCSVVDSYSITEESLRPSQAAGTYYLPKQLLQVQLITTWVRKGNADPVATTKIETNVITVPDERHKMQVGFALSPLSDDNIQVDYEYGMLKQISASTTDRTPDIAIALARNAALLRASEQQSAAPPATIIKTLQFDPYDPVQARVANDTLRNAIKARDISLTMETVTVPGEKKDDKPISKKIFRSNNLRYTCIEVELSPGKWSEGCDEPNLSLKRRTPRDIEPAGTSYDLDDVAKKPGVYYRRALPRMVHVVLDGNHNDIRQLPFANAGQLFRIDIRRSAFVTRETKIAFAAGELTSVSVKKDSEVLAAAKLPVAIVDAYLGTVVDILVRRKQIQEARANYYNALASVILSQQKLGITATDGDKLACMGLYGAAAATECP